MILANSLLVALALCSSPSVARPPSEGDVAAIDAAVSKAAAWVDALAVDPKALREEHHMKGKKHLTEKLFIWYIQWQKESDPARKALLLDRFRKTLAPASDPSFHAFDASDLELFREEIMSYVNADYMATRMGLADPAYKRALDEKVPLLVKDLPNRAVHWQMMFAFFLDRLGYPCPVTVESLAPKGTLAARRALNTISLEEVYAVTHEVFALSSFGEKPVAWPSADARLYAQVALPSLASRFVREKNADILAEVLVSMKYAGQESNPAFADGIRFLVASQNGNGTFGSYERKRAEYKAAKSLYDVDVGGYLHSTETAIWALVEAREVFIRGGVPAVSAK